MSQHAAFQHSLPMALFGEMLVKLRRSCCTVIRGSTSISREPRCICMCDPQVTSLSPHKLQTFCSSCPFAHFANTALPDTQKRPCLAVASVGCVHVAKISYHVL
eukprot:679838-Amphidinium_carterae.1